MNPYIDYWELISDELQRSKPKLERLRDLEICRNQKIITQGLSYPTTQHFQGKTLFERLLQGGKNG